MIGCLFRFPTNQNSFCLKMTLGSAIGRISFRASKKTMNMIDRPDAMDGGISRPCPPNHFLCPPNEKCAPEVRIVPRNIVTGPVPLECILKPVPPKILFVPLQSFVPGRKTRVYAKTKHKISRRRPLFFFGLHP